jgi:hypothetical protein
VSRPRKSGPARPKPEPPKKSSRKPLPEEQARDAIAHEDEAPDGKVRMSVVLARQDAEALAAQGHPRGEESRDGGHWDSRGGGSLRRP